MRCFSLSRRSFGNLMNTFSIFISAMVDCLDFFTRLEMCFFIRERSTEQEIGSIISIYLLVVKPGRFCNDYVDSPCCSQMKKKLMLEKYFSSKFFRWMK
jgi:hypothetical protein